MRPLAYAVPLAFLAACSTPPPAPPATIAEKTDSIAQIFEAPQEYAPRVVDSTAVVDFLVRHPQHLVDSAAILDFRDDRLHRVDGHRCVRAIDR
jgi:hypothetical protein